MRIIAGTLGGRIFNSPHGHRTHPMSDKVRGALFNMLGDMSDLTVLDAFAGSGAIGFEAVSRGAKSVLLIDNDRNAQRTITENIATLSIGDRAKLIKASASAWLRTSEETFDLVLLDPPYDMLQESTLQALSARVAPQGRLVLSWPGKEAAPSFAGFSLVSSKNYGDASLYIFSRS